MAELIMVFNCRAGVQSPKLFSTILCRLGQGWAQQGAPVRARIQLFRHHPVRQLLEVANPRF